MKTTYKRAGRPVVGFNKETGEMVQFDSLTKASEAGFTQPRISKICLEGKGRHRGFEWKYLDEHEGGFDNGLD